MKRSIFICLFPFLLWGCSSSDPIALTVNDFIVVVKQDGDYSDTPKEYIDGINQSRILDLEFLENYHQLSRYTIFNHWYPQIMGQDPEILERLINKFAKSDQFTYLGLGNWKDQPEHSMLLGSKIGGHTLFYKKKNEIFYRGSSLKDERTLFYINGWAVEREYPFLGYIVLKDLGLSYKHRSKIKLKKEELVPIERISFSQLRSNPNYIKDKIVIMTRDTSGIFENREDIYDLGEDSYSGAELIANAILKLVK